MSENVNCLHRAELSSPLGPLVIVFDAASVLHLVDFAEVAPARAALLLAKHHRVALDALPTRRAPDGVAAAFARYFGGEVDALAGLSVWSGGAPFERRVWRALRELPPGATTSYGELARRLGSPGASRAVGRANGANPLGLVVPCHRVVGADGALTGYAGGLENKAWLLAHEARAVAGWPASRSALASVG